MTTSRLNRALEHYKARLTVLEGAAPRLSEEQILDVLTARDAVQAALGDKTPDPAQSLMAVIQLDHRLKRQAAPIAQAIKLAQWRASLNPKEGAWWWSFEATRRPQWWDRFDWLWSGATIVLLTIALGLVVDISPRFLSGGPDTRAIFAVIIQSVLAMLTAGSALTKTGQQAIERILTSLDVPKRFHQEVKLVLAALLVLGLVAFRLSLPRIAGFYNNRGIENYVAGRLSSAQHDFNRALKLNPDYVQAHYNLGSLYEDLQDLENAHTEYKIAVVGGLDAAYNNLARLYILEGNYTAAVSLLLDGLGLAQDGEVKYDMLKNLGWARLGQERYAEADVYLQEAIGLASDKAPAHCLLAQVLQGQEATTRALMDEWKNCLRYASSYNPDEDAWIGLARQRLESLEKSDEP